MSDSPTHRSPLRRALFQIHLWIGVAAGLYVFLIAITGAALLFRIDLQRAAYPELFHADVTRPIEAAVVIEALRRAYPRAKIVGIDAPTTARPTYLAYISEDSVFRTILMSPSNAQVLGELPEHSPIRALQDLHFNLLAGRRGTLINGIGALCLIVSCATGVIIWWPGRARWRRGLQVNFTSVWPRVLRELHGAVGIWSVLMITMWALTALSFTFPRQFRAAANALSPISAMTQPHSNEVHAADSIQPTLSDQILHAERLMPGKFVARIVLPTEANDAIEVLFSSHQPTPAGKSQLQSVFLDQYTGRILPRTLSRRTAGDVIMEWTGSLHTGNFGGLGVRLLWLIFALAPALLFVTGVIIWWRRVVHRRTQS